LRVQRRRHPQRARAQRHRERLRRREERDRNVTEAAGEREVFPPRRHGALRIICEGSDDCLSRRARLRNTHNPLAHVVGGSATLIHMHPGKYLGVRLNGRQVRMQLSPQESQLLFGGTRLVLAFQPRVD
jgi:hypothetical protein